MLGVERRSEVCVIAESQIEQCQSDRKYCEQDIRNDSTARVREVFVVEVCVVAPEDAKDEVSRDGEDEGR